MDPELTSFLRSLEAKLDQVLLLVKDYSSVAPSTSQNDINASVNAHNRLASLEQAARDLGISVSHLRNLQWAEKVPHYRIGAAVRFDVAELRRHFGRIARSRVGPKNQKKGA